MPALQWTPASTHCARWELKSTDSLQRRVVSWLKINHRKVHRNLTPKELFAAPAPPVRSTDGERGFRCHRRTRCRSSLRVRSAEEEDAARPRRGEPGGPSTAPTLRTRTWETPRCPPRAENRRGPCPPAPASGSGVLGGPGGVTSEERAARGAGGRSASPGSWQGQVQIAHGRLLTGMARSPPSSARVPSGGRSS